ncbi:hypothetical protein BH10CYA1_BH10CYA1_55340 [soil metagenome]
MHEKLAVSCVICTHNGVDRIVPTLLSLQKQQFISDIDWEVLIVDNRSSDDLLQVIDNVWKGNEITLLRVVREEQLGLAHARHRAFKEARYPVVSFIDDDVRVDQTWVQNVSNLMTLNTTCGAMGGFGIAVFGATPPLWFERHRERYVVGPQGQAVGDVTETERTLWGAGLTVRMEAINKLIDEGFQQLLVGRHGDALSCGEDTELSLALRLAGWGIFYEPSLTYEHALPAVRMQWGFLRRWYRGFGAASLSFDPYHFARAEASGKLIFWYQKQWQCKILSTLLRIIKDPVCLVKALLFSCEDDDSVLWLEYKIGKLQRILRLRSRYNEQLRIVTHAAWRTSVAPKAVIRSEKLAVDG